MYADGNKQFFIRRNGIPVTTTCRCGVGRSLTMMAHGARISDDQETKLEIGGFFGYQDIFEQKVEASARLYVEPALVWVAWMFPPRYS